MEGEIKVIVPTAEHRAELEAKGIDIEAELTRLVYDHYAKVRDGKHMSSITMKITKEQIDELTKYGVDAPKQIAEEFRSELQNALNKNEKSEV